MPVDGSGVPETAVDRPTVTSSNAQFVEPPTPGNTAPVVSLNRSVVVAESAVKVKPNDCQAVLEIVSGLLAKLTFDPSKTSADIASCSKPCWITSS